VTPAPTSRSTAARAAWLLLPAVVLIALGTGGLFLNSVKGVVAGPLERALGPYVNPVAQFPPEALRTVEGRVEHVYHVTNRGWGRSAQQGVDGLYLRVAGFAPGMAVVPEFVLAALPPEDWQQLEGQPVRLLVPPRDALKTLPLAWRGRWQDAPQTPAFGLAGPQRSYVTLADSVRIETERHWRDRAGFLLLYGSFLLAAVYVVGVITWLQRAQRGGGQP